MRCQSVNIHVPYMKLYTIDGHNVHCVLKYTMYTMFIIILIQVTAIIPNTV